MYGSESELDDSDDETQPARQQDRKQKRKADGGGRLRGDDDDPMDLLSGAATRVTSKLPILLPLKAY